MDAMIRSSIPFVVMLVATACTEPLRVASAPSLACIRPE